MEECGGKEGRRGSVDAAFTVSGRRLFTHSTESNGPDTRDGCTMSPLSLDIRVILLQFAEEWTSIVVYGDQNIGNNLTPTIF